MHKSKMFIASIAIGIISAISAGNVIGGKLPDLPARDSQNISVQSKVRIHTYKFEGNTVFSDRELVDFAEEFLVNYQDQDISISLIYKLKDAITECYIQQGFINSGVIIKDQDISQGILTLTIHEGIIHEITLRNVNKLQPRYIFSRIEREMDQPVNIFDIQKSLQLLQEDRNIDRIHAKLTGGKEPGAGMLNVEIKEARPYSLGIRANNYRSPSTGSYWGEIYGSYRNLSGWGETFGGGYGITEGADDFHLFFDVPVTRWETKLSAHYRESDSSIISDVFRDLDIDSKSEIFSFTLSQPFYRTPQRDFVLSLALERKRSQTLLDGDPFSFSSGVDGGLSVITLAKFAQDFVYRKENSVIAARSSFNFGVDWLNATITDQSADGTFFVWEGQFQTLSRLPFRNNQILFRLNTRIADDQLPPLEKYGIGGRYTVRGYRENLLTRDNGLVASIEYRLPIATVKIPKVSKSVDDGTIILITFFDYGRSWNRNRGKDDKEEDDMSSVGIGLRWDPSSNISAEIFWGYPIDDIPENEEHDLQDEGIHFQVSISLF